MRIKHIKVVFYYNLGDDKYEVYTDENISDLIKCTESILFNLEMGNDVECNPCPLEVDSKYFTLDKETTGKDNDRIALMPKSNVQRIEDDTRLCTLKFIHNPMCPIAEYHTNIDDDTDKALFWTRLRRFSSNTVSVIATRNVILNPYSYINEKYITSLEEINGDFTAKKRDVSLKFQKIRKRGRYILKVKNMGDKKIFIKRNEVIGTFRLPCDNGNLNISNVTQISSSGDNIFRGVIRRNTIK